MALMKLSDKMSLQIKMVEKEKHLTERKYGFLQNIDADEVCYGNLPKWTTSRTDQMMRTAFSMKALKHVLQEDMLELEDEHDQDLQSEQDEQETDQTQHKDPQVSTSLQFSEENTPELSQENMFFQLNHWNTQMGLQVKELRADHMGWMEKSNNIIQKINLTENTVKSLLNQVISLEGQIEKLESPQDLDPDQRASIEEKIMAIQKQWITNGEMDNKFVQADACDEAHELKEKLVARIESLCKDMTVLNTKIGMYQMQEGNTDSQNPEDMNMGEMEPLLLEAPPSHLVQNSPRRITMWKRALRIFMMFYVLTFTGLSCYVLFFDTTFIFERVFPGILGRSRMWELREIITPFLNLAVEDLLPS